MKSVLVFLMLVVAICAIPLCHLPDCKLLVRGLGHHGPPRHVELAVEAGLKEASKKANEEYFLGLESVEKTNKQILLSTTYVMELNVGTSECKIEDDNFNLERCKPKSSKSCKMKVLYTDDNGRLISTDCV